jgi:hypothetical protein
MGVVADATISGFNEYVANLKKDKNEYRLTLTLFDTEVTILEKNTPIAKVKKLTREKYMPNGMTSLYDAVCITLAKSKGNKDKNLVVIMTDGEENSSKEYTVDDMKKAKKELEKGKNWTFVFLGANQDAWITGAKLGMDKGNVATYNNTARGITKTMSVLSACSTSYSASSSSSTAAYFSASDKKLMADTK